VSQIPDEAVPPDFDVAMSFAGEDRAFARDLASALKSRIVLVFFDEDQAPEMWGEDLVIFLDDVYRKRARFAVLLISKHYVSKVWPKHESRSALARGLTEPSPYVLPVRLDDSELPGLRPTVGYLDARWLGVEGIADTFVGKLRNPGGLVPASGWGDRVPRTAEQQAVLLRQRPPGWEYLFFAACLLSEMEASESKFQDVKIGYARPRITVPSDQMSALHGASDRLATIISGLDRMMEPGVQERGFGAPGESGDAEFLQQWAKRLNAHYEDCLDWVSEVRGLPVKSSFSEAGGLLAKFALQPITAYRDFVRETVEKIDRLPSYFARPEPRDPLQIELRLQLLLPDELVAQYLAAVNRALVNLDE